MNRVQGTLVWIDLEMTGLNLPHDTILEIATVVTTDTLEIVAQGPSLVIHHNDRVLNSMNDWCIKYHGQSGLTQASRESTITLEQAEREILEFLKQYVQPQKAPLCGNSVWQDRAFLQAYMPEVDAYLHYRIIDVSSIKEVVRRWYPSSQYAKFVKPENHRAQEDILYSIEELRHYRKYFFVPLDQALISQNYGDNA